MSDPEPVDPAMPRRRTDEHALERHQTFLHRVRDPVGLLFVGDSITRRWVEFPDLWESRFGGWQPANFGVGGDTTSDVLWRLANGELAGIDPRVVVLLVGTNNVPTDAPPRIAAGIRAVVDLIRERLPRSALLLHAIFPRGPQDPHRATPGNPRYMDKIRAVNRGIAARADGAAIRYVDIGDRYLGPDGEIRPECMPDGLHLVRPGYEIWADALSGYLDEMMR